MTICIAAICDESNSLVIAADSMLTSSSLSIQFEHPRRKINPLSERCVALTAGDALAHTELFGMVSGEIVQLKDPSVSSIVDTIKSCYQKIRKSVITERYLLPRGFSGFEEYYSAQKHLMPEIAMSIQQEMEHFDYGLDIIVAGVTDGVSHIYGISDPGTSMCFDAVGFHAIGSGLPHAINTLIARGHHQGTELVLSVITVYEAKKMAEKAPGVGSDFTDLTIIRRKGVCEIPREKISRVNEAYDKWITRDDGWKDQITELLKEVKAL